LDVYGDRVSDLAYNSHFGFGTKPAPTGLPRITEKVVSPTGIYNFLDNEKALPYWGKRQVTQKVGGNR